MPTAITVRPSAWATAMVPCATRRRVGSRRASRTRRRGEAELVESVVDDLVDLALAVDRAQHGPKPGLAEIPERALDPSRRSRNERDARSRQTGPTVRCPGRRRSPRGSARRRHRRSAGATGAHRRASAGRAAGPGGHGGGPAETARSTTGRIGVFATASTNCSRSRSPRWGWFQRANPWYPTSSPVSRSTTGCTCGSIRPWLTATASSSVSVCDVHLGAVFEHDHLAAPIALARYIAASARCSNSAGESEGCRPRDRSSR